MYVCTTTAQYSDDIYHARVLDLSKFGNHWAINFLENFRKKIESGFLPLFQSTVFSNMPIKNTQKLSSKENSLRDAQSIKKFRREK